MFVTATGCSGIISADYSMGYSAQQAIARIECTGFSGSLNDALSLDMGTKSSHAVVFTGKVKEITEKRSASGWHYSISAYDQLIMASDFFIAADDPDDPMSVSNIAAEDLVDDLLEAASITDYSYTSPGLTLAVSQPYRIDRVYAIDMINRVAAMAGYHVWTSPDGTVNFKELLPYAAGSPSHVFTTGNAGELVEISRTISEASLRNRIVVYGAAGLVGISSGSSPYLPSGFYKTAVIGHPIMDTQAAVDACAAANLTIMNRLTESLRCAIVGDTSVQFGQTVTVTESKTGTTGDWFVNDIQHTLSKSGFVTRLTLLK